MIDASGSQDKEADGGIVFSVYLFGL